MHPSPSQRPTYAQVLGDKIFTREGVDSDSARNLLKAIASGNQEQITAAKNELDRVIEAGLRQRIIGD